MSVTLFALYIEVSGYVKNVCQNVITVVVVQSADSNIFPFAKSILSNSTAVTFYSIL